MRTAFNRELPRRANQDATHVGAKHREHGTWFRSELHDVTGIQACSEEMIGKDVRPVEQHNEYTCRQAQLAQDGRDRTSDSSATAPAWRGAS